jgi:dTDP-4-dehydrorhamnose 3,5-epimerase
MKIIDVELGGPHQSGLKLVELRLHGDARGFFVERFVESRFRAAGIENHFVQDNHSRSAPGILRGLHYQTAPAQGKLVGVVRGRIWDVAVDIRPHSPSFGKWFGTELSDMNGKLLWIPPGFAHGFCVLGNEPADVLYKVDGEYNASTEGGILWNDPDLAIAWPIEKPLISGRDEKLVSFRAYQENPIDWKGILK